MNDVTLEQAIQIAALLGVAAAAWGVVRTRDPARQTVGVSFYGLVLAVTFFVFRAPDVALSQLVVGAVALPLMLTFTLAKIGRERRAGRK